MKTPIITDKHESLRIFVHVDADPKNLHTNNAEANKAHESFEMEWSSLTSTFSFFKAFLEKMERQGVDFKSTFFLRADEQVKNLGKQYSAAFRKFHDDFSRLFCVGWHPHLFRWSNQRQLWQQEHRDNKWISQVLTDTYEDLKSQGFDAQFSKMGWCFHNNTSMKTLSELGIKADFSALPGALSPGRLIGGSSFQDRYDWSRTRPYPYHPSEADYQGLGSLRILEIPLTTYEVNGPREFFYTMKLALSSYRRFDFSYSPSFRRMVPLFLLDLVKLRSLREFCERLMQGNRDYVTLYLHPGDLLNATAQTVFEDFVLRLLSAAEAYGRKASFVDAQELCSSYSSVG